MRYYCKNCNNKIGFFNEIKKYIMHNDCFRIKSKNNKFIYFLDCKKCNKFVGLLCVNVCENCFGKDKIIGEEKLKKWFLKYKKLTPTYKNHEFNCEICNKQKFRWQHWFFKELTFYKK